MMTKRTRPTPWLMLLAGSVVAPLVLMAAEGPDGAETGPVLHNGDVPIGSLGHPLGDDLTIEGVRLDAMKTGVRTLRVEAINGRTLREPLIIWVNNLDLPPRRRCKIKGYETIEMIGKPPAESAADREAGRPDLAPQKGWGVFLTFVALRVVEPEGLAIRKRP